MSTLNVFACHKFYVPIKNLKLLLQFVVLSALILNMGCSDSSDKRNVRQSYSLYLQSRQCGVNINKTFTTQLDLCQYIAYEAGINTCLYYDLQAEFRRRSCTNVTVIGQVPGAIIDNSLPIVPDGVIIADNSNYWNDLNNTYQSILDYYTVDPSGCIATENLTRTEIELCLDDVFSGYEKDQDFDPNAQTTTSSNEKDEEFTGVAFPPEPKPGSENTGVVTTNPTVATAPPRSQNSNRLDYNLVTYNARSLRDSEITDYRLPVLAITGTTDPKSPIYNLIIDSSDVKDIQFTNVTTTCPIKSRIVTSGNTIILTLFSKAGSTPEQITTCRSFFDSIATIPSLEFKFAMPLVMSNGVSQDVPFKFVNQ